MVSFSCEKYNLLILKKTKKFDKSTRPWTSVCEDKKILKKFLTYNVKHSSEITFDSGQCSTFTNT